MTPLNQQLHKINTTLTNIITQFETQHQLQKQTPYALYLVEWGTPKIIKGIYLNCKIEYSPNAGLQIKATFQHYTKNRTLSKKFTSSHNIQNIAHISPL